MTRKIAFCVAIVFLLNGVWIVASAQAQTNVGAAAGARQQPAPVYGPAPAGVRQVAGEAPIRQPQLPQRSSAQGNAPAIPLAAMAAAPQPPKWFPLSPELDAYVDSILQYWETRSNQIKTYRTEFQRWDYDPVFGPKDQPLTYSTGVIQYANPDKGLFRVDSISKNTPATKPGEKSQWIKQDGVHGEHWVSDGKRVFEFDSRNKRVIERRLPPELEGKAITDGPLPFMFGAKAATIKARYWINAVTPPEAKNEYWLEAHPKSRQDAANFKMVLVVLDKADYLPKLLQVFSPNFDVKQNPAKTAYQFDKREVNKVDLLGGLANLNPFFREFYEPKTPAGWKKEIENVAAPAAPQFPPAAGPAQATRPGTTPSVQR